MSKEKAKIKKAIEILSNKGLFYCSTKTQKENGTLYFVDPKTMAGYSITKSGYIRRHTFGNSTSTRLGERHYQLNKTGRWGNAVTRILEPGKYVKLAKQLSGPVENWRKNI